jgi:hypothetical protein
MKSDVMVGHKMVPIILWHYGHIHVLGGTLENN